MRSRRTLCLAGVGAAIAVYATVALVYALAVPVGRSADEFSHLNYAHLIADHAALPGADVLERQQPPLYYLVSAALFKVGAPDRAARLLSVVLGAITIAAVAATAWRAGGRRPWLAIGSAWVLALLPGFQFVSASVTDDSLAFAVGALLLLVACRVLLAPRVTAGLLLTAGALSGVALLAKETDWPLVAVLLVAVAVRSASGSRLRDTALVAGPAVAIAGWWYLRNLADFRRPLPPLTIGPPRPHLRQLGELRGFASATVRSLFGPQRYQGGLVDLPRIGEVLLAMLALALGAALLVAAVGAVRSWPGWNRERRGPAVVLGSAFGLAVVFLVLNSVILDYQAQGRYLLVAATGPVIAVAWAAERLGRRHRRAVTAATATWIAASLALSGIGLHAALVQT